MPVAVDKVTPDGFEFSVSGSKALAGCDDFVLRMKRVGDKTFEGQFGDGRRVTLSKQ